MLPVVPQAKCSSHCQGAARGATAAAAPCCTQAGRLKTRWCCQRQTETVGNRGCSGSCAPPGRARTSRLSLLLLPLGLFDAPMCASAICPASPVWFAGNASEGLSLFLPCLALCSAAIFCLLFSCSFHWIFTRVISTSLALFVATCFPPADLFCSFFICSPAQ